MPSKTQNIKLGIFLTVTAILFMLVLVFVGGQALWVDRDVYYIESEKSIGGIDVESSVTMYGVKVGEVEAIELDEENYDSVRVVLALDDDVKVPAGAKAYLETQGLTGLKVVELSGGDLSRGVQPPGSYIPRGETTLETLEQRVGDLVPKVEEAVEETRQLIASLRAIAQSVDPKTVEHLVGQTDSLVAELAATSGLIRETVAENRPELRSILQEVETATTKANALLADADTTSEEIEAAIRNANELVEEAHRVLRVNEDDVRAMMYNLRRTSQNAEMLSRELREQPSRLLFSEPPPPRELP